MNAVILAAGVGLRMREVAQRGHKVLLPIGGVSIIERIIRYLKEAGIEDITVITGHKKELLKHLAEAYDVKLLHNKKYSVNNNLRSIEMVLDQIGDTFIIHSDVALFKNVFKEKPETTFFYTILKESKGIPVFHPLANKQRVIEGYETYAGKEAVTSLLGISYWTKEDAKQLRTYFETNVNEKFKRKYHVEWDQEVLKLYTQMKIEAHQIDRKYAKDVNLTRDYLEACYTYDQHWKKK